MKPKTKAVIFLTLAALDTVLAITYVIRKEYMWFAIDILIAFFFIKAASKYANEGRKQDNPVDNGQSEAVMDAGITTVDENTENTEKQPETTETTENSKLD